MLELHIEETAQVPIYRQIVEQVKHLIASGRLVPGEHLPPVRGLARSLRISPGTVARAYLELERERIVVSRRGGGTQVADTVSDQQRATLRQRRLWNAVSDSILELLSWGYRPEELEVAFSLNLARWREERQRLASASVDDEGVGRSGDTIVLVGSHDLALTILVDQLKKERPDIAIELSYAGSLGGLIALQEGRAHLAGIHLLDEESGEYNYPYLRHLLPGRAVAVVHLAYRVQGLMMAPGNPKGITGLEDLRRPGVTIVNRQQGSGTRVLLDLELRRHGIAPSQVDGYGREVDTHLAVASAIARGEADVGLGIAAAALTCNVDFLPLSRERYDLVIPMESYRSGLLAPLLEAIVSEAFTDAVASVGGYDTSETGATAFYNN